MELRLGNVEQNRPLLFSTSGRLDLVQTTARLHGERLLLHPHSLRLSGPGSAQTPA